MDDPLDLRNGCCFFEPLMFSRLFKTKKGKYVTAH
uniref:Uncharacterized protein n=1 Tax=Rhizophora mucronata TaxID=61149 RepID=A0A2P2MXP2_RHIMU